MGVTKGSWKTGRSFLIYINLDQQAPNSLLLCAFVQLSLGTLAATSNQSKQVNPFHLPIVGNQTYDVLGFYAPAPTLCAFPMDSSSSRLLFSLQLKIQVSRKSLFVTGRSSHFLFLCLTDTLPFLPFFITYVFIRLFWPPTPLLEQSK